MCTHAGAGACAIAVVERSVAVRKTSAVFIEWSRCWFAGRSVEQARRSASDERARRLCAKTAPYRIVAIRHLDLRAFP